MIKLVHKKGRYEIVRVLSLSSHKKSQIWEEFCYSGDLNIAKHLPKIKFLLHSFWTETNNEVNMIIPVLPLIAIATVTLLHKLDLLTKDEAKGYLREVIPTILPEKEEEK